jgi:asparagine synthetase B (glutamine-hydrolysing)
MNKIKDNTRIIGDFTKKGNKFYYQNETIINDRVGSIIQIKNNEILIESDVFGIDKIFYSIIDNKIIISEKFNDFLDNEINEKYVEAQNLIGYVPYPFTILKNVRKALPGLITIIKYDENGKVKIKYEKSKQLEVFFKDGEYDKENFGPELNKLMKKNYSKFEGLVSSFSGGFDSLFLTKTHLEVCKYILHFSEDKEVDLDYYKKMFLKAKWIIAESNIDFDDKDRKEYFKAIDEPCCDPAGFAEYLMIKEISKNKEAMRYPIMNGQSSDGIFGNGRKYFQEYLSDKHKIIRKIKVPDKAGMDHFILSKVFNFTADTKKRFMKCYVSNYEFDKKETKELNEIFDLYRKSIKNDSTNSLAAIVMMVRYSCYELEKIKTAAKANNIKYYLPFLETNVVKLAFNVPSKYKVGFNLGKQVLLKSFPEILNMKFISRDFKPNVLKERFIEQKLTLESYRHYFFEGWMKYNK